MEAGLVGPQAVVVTVRSGIHSLYRGVGRRMVQGKGWDWKKMGGGMGQVWETEMKSTA